MNNLAWTKIIAGLIVIHCWIVIYHVTEFFDHPPQVLLQIANTTSVEVVTKELPKKNYSNFLNIYTLKTFIRRQDKFPVRHDLCIVTKGNVLVSSIPEFKFVFIVLFLLYSVEGTL